MPARTPRQAVEIYLQVVRQSLSCVTQTYVGITRYSPQSEPHALTLNQGRPTPLRGTSGLYFDLRQHYRLTETPGERWEVEVAAYLYAVRDDEHEILAYHWHPRGNSAVVSPHLHLSAGAKIGRGELIKAHLPTGHVTLGSFIRTLIEVFGAEPLRSDWPAIL